MGFKQRKLVEVAFDKPGTTIEGRLLRATRVRYSDGVGMKYLLRDGSGTLVGFKGSARLDVLLQTSDLGKLVKVVYVGLDNTRDVKEGFNAPKVFDVYVDEDSAEAGSSAAAAVSDPLGITDDDIPF